MSRERTTAELKKDEAVKMVEDMLDQFQTSPEAVFECLRFGERFNRYSMRNMMLIYSQNPYATYVQSFQDWKEEGVSVKKGEHGLMLLVPVLVTYLKLPEGLVQLKYATKEQKEQYEKKEIDTVTYRRFRVGTTFDISQTTFPVEDYPKLFSMGYESSEHKQIAEGIMSYAKWELGVPVKVEELSSISLRGYYEPGKKEITLNALMKDTQFLSTLTHELSHAICDHKISEGKSEAQREYEADCMSVMLEAHFGLEVNDTRKKHFKDHHETWMKELRKGFEKLSEADQRIEEKIKEKQADAFAFVFDNYKSVIKDLEPYVERSLQKEGRTDLFERKPGKNQNQKKQTTRKNVAANETRIADKVR